MIRVVIGGHALPEAWLVSQMVGGSMEASLGALPLCICGFSMARPRSSFPAPVLVMGIRYYPSQSTRKVKYGREQCDSYNTECQTVVRL